MPRPSWAHIKQSDRPELVEGLLLATGGGALPCAVFFRGFGMNYWLMKSEPSAFGIEDLERSADQTTCWDGVRNYQARNFLRDDMKNGDRAFLYHSSCPTPGIVGTIRVVREAYPDPTAFDAAHPHFDPDSDPARPRWYMVDVALERKFSRVITLAELRRHAEHGLRDMLILKRGNRLSITPLTAGEWRSISSLLDV